MPYRLVAGDCCTVGEYRLLVGDNGFFDLDAEQWCVSVAVANAPEDWLPELLPALLRNGWLAQGPPPVHCLPGLGRLLDSVASARLVQSVHRAEVNGTGPGGSLTLGDLATLGFDELSRMRGVGRATVLEAQQLCQRYGVAFGTGK